MRAIEQKLVDENPTVTEFRRILGRTYNDLGLLQSQTGESAEALESLRRAVVVRQKLAEDNPAIPSFRNVMAASQTNAADLLRAMGRIAEARERYERAIAVREELVKADPNVMLYRNGLAMSVRRLGLLRWACGDAAGAISDIRRAVDLFEKLRSRSGEHWYELACCHATLAAAAGEGSGISSGDVEAEAGNAMDLLRRAAAAGYRDARAMARDVSLDPLRNRPDFRLFLLDLAFPGEPFSRSH